MAYTVDKTNSSASPSSYTVQDGVLNTQTDLKFIGKGYAGYGEVIHENFLHLLENLPTTLHLANLFKDSYGTTVVLHNLKFTQARTLFRQVTLCHMVQLHLLI